MSRLTPMQQHQMRTLAARANSTQAEGEAKRALKWLHTQRCLLNSLQSRQAREAHKAQVMPEIEPYLWGILEADAGGADPVMSHATVWALDAGNWPLAMQLAAYAMRHSLPMPDEFKRNAPTLVLDLMADAALRGSMSAADAREHLPKALTLTEGANMPDQTRAKAHKAIAYGLAGRTTLAGDAGDWKNTSAAALTLALKHLTQAEQLDPNAGVKKDIAAVQKLIDAANKNPTPPDPRPGTARKTTRATAKKT